MHEQFAHLLMDHTEKNSGVSHLHSVRTEYRPSSEPEKGRQYRPSPTSIALWICYDNYPITTNCTTREKRPEEEAVPQRPWLVKTKPRRSKQKF